VFVVDRGNSLYAIDAETDVYGTEEQVKRLLRKVNRLLRKVNSVIVQVSDRYDVYLDYKKQEE
jgi:hypothetical protein